MDCRPLVLLGLVGLAGCGGSPAAPESKTPPAEPAPVPTAGPTVQAGPAAQSSANAPEISRSVGVEGGVVLLWPRVPGARDADSSRIALGIQRRLSTIIKRALPGRSVDVRPEPERVCPRSGCKAVAVGAVLSRSGNGCAVAALVSAPGESATRIVPWAGNMNLRSPTVPFRQPPEAVISVDDYQSCGALDGDLAAHEADVEAALRAAK
jgi:hypothetical protein